MRITPLIFALLSGITAVGIDLTLGIGFFILALFDLKGVVFWMIYNVIGLESKKVFFTGTRADCHKQLINDFPTFYEKDYEKRGAQVMIPKVLPEPMQIRRTR